MTQTVNAGQRHTIRVPAYSQVVVSADAVSSGAVYASDFSLLGSIAASGSLTIGPYADVRAFTLAPAAGTLTYADASAVDYPTAAEALAAGVAAFQPLVGSDVLDLAGAGAPVDYTDGTPPATGEGVAGIGSRYTDVTAGKLYLNGGTKAQPLWKIVTSA